MGDGVTQADARPSPLVMIHLSDIHFGQEKGFEADINNDVRERLIDCVAQIVKERALAKKPPITSIVVTGDIAHAGKKNEYDTAREWLDKLAKAAGTSDLNIQVVPGNHDVDRSRISYPAKLLIDDIRRGGQDALDKALDDQRSLDLLYDRFAEYQDFAGGYGCELSTKGGHAGIKEYPLGPGRTLRIVGFNSAILSDAEDSKEPPNLILGTRQTIIQPADGIEWVVLIHHPLDWIIDQASARDYIMNRARILMCGHEHRPNFDLKTVEGNERVLLIDAGATTPKRATEEYTYTFNIIEIGLADSGCDLDVQVESYIWRDSQKKFVKDKERFGGNHSRQDLLKCPRFAEAINAERNRPEVADSGNEAAAEVEIEPLVVLEQSGVAPGQDDAVLFGTLRRSFFHELSPSERLQVLVDLDVIPPDLTAGLTTNIMAAAIEMLRHDHRLEELEAAIGRRRGSAANGGI